jgi:hypothetical protein
MRRAARFMDAAAHGGQVVTDLELLRKVMAVWASQDKDNSADSTADSNVQGGLTPIEASPRDHLESPQQRQQQQQQQPRRSEELPGQQQQAASAASFSGSEVGQLPVWSKAKRWPQLTSTAAAAAAAADSDPQGLLVPAQRSRSETYTARQVTFSLPPHPQRFSNLQQQQQQRAGLQFLRGGNCSSSFTYGARPRIAAALGSSGAAAAAADVRVSPLQALLLSQGSLPAAGRAAATLTGLPEAGVTITSPDGVAAAQCEPVRAMHLGTFVFKGSGEFQMVHVLHASLAKRQFPAEPPKGKGQRLVTTSGEVDGLAEVSLQIPQCLLAARRMFLLGE